MLINKQSMPLVAMEFMNEVHGEDVEIINHVFELILTYENEPTESNKSNVNQKYREWVEHTVAHFRREEAMMIEKSFPPYPVHKGEHDNALLIMDGVFNAWQQEDDIQILKRYFVEELPRWLVTHIQTMDTVTAMFFKTGLSPCAMH